MALRTDHGHIWLRDQRMVLLHAGALGAPRKELAASLGLDRTRGLLTRMGYSAGVRDARSARRLGLTRRQLAYRVQKNYQ